MLNVGRCVLQDSKSFEEVKYFLCEYEYIWSTPSQLITRILTQILSNDVRRTTFESYRRFTESTSVLKAGDGPPSRISTPSSV